MEVNRPKTPALLGIIASAMGLFFSAFSTHDYAQHLDRQLHNTHCSFIPGLSEATAGTNPCTVAMYSPYSALFRDKFWGGVPISLFAMGAYAFFLALSVYLLVAGVAASKRAYQAFGLLTFSPVIVSAVMFTISATQLGHFCKLCVGLYISSIILLVGGILALVWAGGRRKAGGNAEDTMRDPAPFGQQVPPGYPQPAYAVPAQPTVAMPLEGMVPTGSFLVIPALFAGIGLFSVAPSGVYIAALPDYATYLKGCGTLPAPEDKAQVLIKFPTKKPVQPATMFVDPLCPTCKAFHERLVSEGVFEKLDLRVAVFPLDNECNWMLDRALHPGACTLARAVLCGDKVGKAREILEWSYENQDSLTTVGKSGKDPKEANANVRVRLKERFGDIDACLDSKETKQRLDKTLHYAVANKMAVSTPQLFLGDQRVCDEDTDLGLRYTLGQLAPKLNEVTP